MKVCEHICYTNQYLMQLIENRISIYVEQYNYSQNKKSPVI